MTSYERRVTSDPTPDPSPWREGEGKEGVLNVECGVFCDDKTSVIDIGMYGCLFVLSGTICLP